MYIRATKQHELVEWLLNRNNKVVNFTEQEAEQLAEALIAKFDLIAEYRTR